ncbi:MAG TPA: hypothetical protein VF556_17055 [Pyrinomonadaceae bacterium]|jgi:fluoride ion exporter CrcB/FEX
MPSVSIACGILLMLIGVIGYAYGMIDGKASLTALIPALFGLVLVALGAVSRAKEHLQKHLMHGAVMVGLIGFIATASSFFKIPALLNGTAERPAAIIAQLATAAVCLIFVLLCVKSFADARRNRVI